MSLTLGLSSALSGLLTAQQSLNVISQNITNVNTPGYARQVANPTPLTLNGVGAGVTLGATTRVVDDALMRSLNTQSTTLGGLNAEQQYYPQMENLFGQVSDSGSISATLQSLGTAFQQLSTQGSQSAQQSGTVQAAQDATTQLNSMTQSLQNMRLSADSQISGDVDHINTDLNNLYSLNQKIVRNTAIKASVADLDTQRDNTLTDLSKYIKVQYFTRDDGSTVIYTPDGKALLDNQPNLLSHAATTTTAAWMTAAGGQFDKITINNGSTDITSSLSEGEVGALVQVRDSIIPNFQAQIDELSKQLKDIVNQVSNRGTSLPNITNSYTGSKVFATQGKLVVSAGETADTITYNQGGSTISGGAGGAGGTGGAGYGQLAFSYSNVNGQMTITATPGGTGASATSLSALQTPGTVFTIAGSAATDPNNPTATNNGTYTVIGYDSATNQLTVAKANPIQTVSITGGDVMVQLFDSNGNAIQTVGSPTPPTISNIMGTDFSGATGDPQLKAAAANATAWSLDSVTKHMTAWLQQQGYTGASCGINANGQLNVTLGSTAQATLTFRDQTSGTMGATAGDVTVNFDTNGDGTVDSTTKGFSNFFGLNDIFVTNQPVSVLDSQIQPTNFQSVAARSLTLSDNMGQVGNGIYLKAGMSLQQIADTINADTVTSQSSVLAPGQLPLVINSTATIGISNAAGLLSSVTLPPKAGGYTLDDIATALTSGNIVASVQYSGTNRVLSVRDTTGEPISVDVSGGQINSQTTLGSLLDMQTVQRIRAEVVPEGSGQRLRLVQSSSQAIYASASKDALGNSMLTDLGIGDAASGVSGVLDVRSDLKGNPSAIVRGAVQWNADTNSYFLSEGDNTTSLQLANAMTSQYHMNGAGQIAAGNYTLTGHASASISLVATASSNSTSQQTYQTTLNNSLTAQYASVSGVNIDEEVTRMMAFQSAYSASARVISVLQEMMTTLTDLVR